MKAGKRIIYWDTTCWLAWLNGEGTEVWSASVVEGIKDVVEEAENNKVILFTSTITRAEIFEAKLSQEQKDKYSKLLRRHNVTQVEPSIRVMDRASQIREYHSNQREKRRISTPDAIHLATAMLNGADEFQTMDGLRKDGKSRKLLAISGDVGGHNLKIVNPYPLHAPPPAELVTIKGPLFLSEGDGLEKDSVTVLQLKEGEK
jgi:predicted nucleic acid-binding protein